MLFRSRDQWVTWVPDFVQIGDPRDNNGRFTHALARVWDGDPLSTLKPAGFRPRGSAGTTSRSVGSHAAAPVACCHN